MKPIILLSVCILTTTGAFVLLSSFAPVNPHPCFGTAKDGRLRWHSHSECAH